MPPDDQTNSREDHRVFTIQIDRLERDLQNLGGIMREGFASLEKKLDERLGGRDKRLDEHDEKMDRLQSRVDRLEVRMGVLWGVMAVVGMAVAGTIWQVVTAGSGL